MLIAQLVHLRALARARVVLRDLVDGEVGDVGAGAEIGLEGCADAAELVPGDATEERVGFDFLGAILAGVAAEAVVDVAEHAVGPLLAKA